MTLSLNRAVRTDLSVPRRVVISLLLSSPCLPRQVVPLSEIALS